ncbi:MAG: spore coat protein U domain-containing protein, partial [Proteobacteria bacterium]|nr:spore coat protein U domain-containing protein [Pseudomonadota bacterium]
MRNSVSTTIAAGVLLALAGAAQAATKTGSFQVTATVSKNCIISAPNLNLGIFDGTNDLTMSSTISVNCTNLTPYTVD